MRDRFTPEAVEAVRGAIASYMDEYRLRHTLGVWEQCREMGALFAGAGLLSGEECIKLQIAGLLHDISKQKKGQAQRELWDKYGVESFVGIPFEKLSAPVLHQSTGAFMARDLFGDVADEEIFTAISCHTTGREEMTLFDKLLYLADYIEPGRDFADCVALRLQYYAELDAVAEDPERLSAHIDQLMMASYDMTILDLLKGNALVDERTVRARNDLIQKMSKRS